MQLVICNNTKENFLWEPEKMNVKFHKMASYTWSFKILPVFSQFLWNLTFIFSDSGDKFSLVLLQMTDYIVEQ